MTWPATAEALLAEQDALGRVTPDLWTLPPRASAIGGCFVCFPRGEHGPGRQGDAGWAAAVVLHEGEPVGRAVVGGVAGAPYEPGLLALREGALLEAAVRAVGLSLIHI